MATKDTNIILNNYSDDSKSKQYISDVLMPRVFHDIPLTTLNSGAFSIVSEYMSQALENLAFTSSFYLNESFITKAVLADSIYAHAAIFNIGYSYAIPSVCNFMIELKLEDLRKNAKENPENRNIMEFILDKNTKINLANGSIYSLDYDILIQFTNTDNPTWNIQYTNVDEQNSIAINKKPYILYRTSSTWLHIFVAMSEYERQTHTCVCNMTNGIPNDDFVITCQNHIAGFDIKYVDGEGNEQYLDTDHILPMHASVKDQLPYVHYIMDSPQTIRFKFQLDGNRYFVPKMNSSFIFTVYTCHGEAANFSSFTTEESVSIITSTNKYSNNGNVQKTAFVTSGSAGATNIGTNETTRRETIEAYNTANVISSDHDIYEWFKTFLFKRILYPFFFKRRDDPWGRIWSGFIALTDPDGEVYRTNTLHAQIPYRLLYNSSDGIISSNGNEIIIPPGWAWIYKGTNRYTVKPLVVNSNEQIETASTAVNVDEEFLFANPFGIRIQKYPFAIGYFNPWINTVTSTSIVNTPFSYQSTVLGDADESIIYHGTPSFVHITRTYQKDYYHIDTVIIPNQAPAYDGSNFVSKLRANAVIPTFTEAMWNYFVKPSDMYAKMVPILVQDEKKQYIVFNPEATYLCVTDKIRTSDSYWTLSGLRIEDNSGTAPKEYPLPISDAFSQVLGSNDLWGDNGPCEAVKVTGDTEIHMYPPVVDDDPITFQRKPSQNYYELRLDESQYTGRLVSMTTSKEVYPTTLTKYGETRLYRIGQTYASSVYVQLKYDDGVTVQYQIGNAANIYTPYTPVEQSDGTCVFNLNEINANGIILYADMKPSASESAVAYYKMPLSAVLDNPNVPLFYLESNQLGLEQNNLRVLLEAKVDGTVTGRVEMQPVRIESDGSIRFDTTMYPLNKMVDVDNRIKISSLEYGGGSWVSTTPSKVVTIDATSPELTIYLLFKSTDGNLPSPIDGDESFKGYRLQDRWRVDDFSLVQELKEMRSVVNFGEYQQPSASQMDAYERLIKLIEYDPVVRNLYTIKQYAYHIISGTIDDSGLDFDDIRTTASECNTEINAVIIQYANDPEVPDLQTEYMNALQITLTNLSEALYASNVDWDDVYAKTMEYAENIDQIFTNTSVNSAMEVQLMPLVQATMMNSDMFESFVSAFTQVHKAIEPVIFKRLEGNNYLDCKLIATYGLPHSYVSDVDKDLTPPSFWPDLDVQIEFDVKLYNPGLSTNTLNELRTLIKSYFNRITTVHTPVDMISMDNNIYISQLIQQLEEHPNVAYLRFKGWYTNQKNLLNGHYMNADYQAIVQRWDTLDDMPKNELERYVPEMFVLSDSNIVLNIL